MKRRKSELYYEEIGEKFNEYMSDYDVSRRKVLIGKLLPKMVGSYDVLEIGCGTGKISEYLVERVKSLTVADISRKLAKETGERLGTKYEEQDICSLSIDSNRYDLVLSSECIEHAPDPIKAIFEMIRVTRPGGWTIITSPNKLWYPVLVMARLMKIRKFEGNEIWLFPRRARTIYDNSGYRNINIMGCHLFPWQLPGAKRILPRIDERFGRSAYPIMINYGISGEKPQFSKIEI